MAWQAIGEEVELHSAVPDGEGAHVARVVVVQLGAALYDADRRELLSVVPDWLRDALSSTSYAGEGGEEGLYGRVASELSVPPPRAMELTKLVCSSVTHRVPDDVVRVLRSHLPEDVAALLVDRPHEPDLHRPVHAPPVPRPRPGEGHTLSSGKPGSHAPLATEKPGSDHPVSEDD